jgi:hypothetical protein
MNSRIGRRSRNALAAAAVALVVFLTWAYKADRLTAAKWDSPLGTTGDALLTTASIRAGMEGDFTPLLPKGPKRLGAPFKAEWETWPVTEELLVWLTGVAGRVIGLYPAISTALMLSHVLAALAFFFVARRFGHRLLWSAAFAVLLGTSWYIFARGLGHITIAYAWHVPLCWLVICYAWSRGGLWKTKRRIAIALIVAVITGLQNPYFTFIFVQFLAIAAVLKALRAKQLRAALPPLSVIAVTMASFGAMQFDTLSHRLRFGSASAAAIRSYADMELYALKPLDLLLPIFWPVPWLQQRLAEYQQFRAIPGEHPLNYMGVIAVVGAVLLVVISFKRVVVDRRPSITFNGYAIPAVWIILVGMVGGLLGFASLLSSVYFFRGANRFSIFIIVILYLFLSRAGSAVTRRLRLPAASALAIAAVALGLWELPAARSAAATEADRTAWKQIQKFVREVERTAGAGAMIFVLPVTDFPEAAPRLNEGHYAPLQLYVPNSTLRFSYGNNRGAYRDMWQRSAEIASPGALAGMLSSYGFSGIVLFREAYADRGEAILQALAAAGHPVSSQTNTMTFVPLQPAPQEATQMPATARIALGAGWEPVEFDAAGNPVLFANGDAEMRLTIDDETQAKAYLSAVFDAGEARSLELICNETSVLQLNMRAGIRYRIESLQLPVQPGLNRLALRTELLGPAVPRPDGRKLAIGVRGLAISGLSGRNDAGQPNPHVRTSAEELEKLRADGAPPQLLEVTNGTRHLWREFASPAGSPLIGTVGQPVERIEFLPGDEHFSLACLVEPTAETQVPHADVFSSHTGDFTGLSLERVAGADDNRYQLAIGDGTTWIPLGAPVTLQPGARYLVHLEVSDRSVSVRVRGHDTTLEVSHPLDAATNLSNKLWSWGNWLHGDRKFAGRIQLLMLRGRPIESAELNHLMRAHGIFANQPN